MLKIEKQESIYNDQDLPRMFGTAKTYEDTVIYNFNCICRETFLDNHYHSTKEWIVYYSPSIKTANNIVKFLKVAEKKLIKKNRSKFYIVGRKLFIKKSEFWNSKFRIGLLTILIRAGTRYKKTTFKKCLYSCIYLRSKHMQDAVKTFFKGKTKYTSQSPAINGHWVRDFSYYGKSSIDKMKR